MTNSRKEGNTRKKKQRRKKEERKKKQQGLELVEVVQGRRQTAHARGKVEKIVEAKDVVSAASENVQKR